MIVANLPTARVAEMPSRQKQLCVFRGLLVASGKIYGLVAPGYEMAEAVAKTVAGGEQAFTGADMSTKLKLMGVDVASFGRYSGFKVQP